MLHLHILCVSIYYLLYSLLNFGSNFRSLLIFILFIIYRFEEMHLHGYRTDRIRIKRLKGVHQCYRTIGHCALVADLKLPPLNVPT